MALALRNNRPVAFKEYAMEQTKDSIAWLRDYITAIKNGRFHPFTALERKTREATRNEAWGPTGTLLNELADASFDGAGCEIIYALTVLEFLIKRGSDQCVENAQNLKMRLEDLQVFEYTSPDGRDHGVNVRHRALAISVLLKDTARLEQERAAFANKRQVYKGFSREQLSNGAVQRTHSADSMEGPYASANAAHNRQQGSHEQEASSRYNSGYGAPTSAARNAGEMKGVTMEENKQQLAALKKLLDLPHNKQCADCVGGGGAARASWASINTGVFICMRCAGIHRGLGVHVRSCTLDTWLPQQVSFMAVTGNAAANSYWEAKLGPGQKPHYESSDLEAFIRRKYCNKEFAEGAWPPALPEQPASAATADGSPAGVARQKPGASASTATSPGAVPQLASDPSAGRLEAGGFWGSLTPQESGVPVDQLLDGPVIGSITPGRLQSQRLPQSRQPIGVNAESPALLIDLMDFGAESTIQLPTTPRRQSSNAPSVFDTASSNVAAGNAAVTIAGSSKGPASAAAAAPAPAANRQRSSFPLLPPPPQALRPQQPTTGSAAAPPTRQPQTFPSKDMAVNTDMGGLEELVMNPDVMIPDPADPFSMQHSYPQPHTSDASTSGRSHQYDAQQHAVYPQPQMADASSSSRQYGSQQPPIVSNAGLNGVGGGDGAQPARQPSQPIFFQGQWFTPAPPGFTPPPPQQHQYGLTHQQQGMQQQGQGLQQQHVHAGYQHQQHPVYQSYQQPPQQQQQQQQQSFMQLPQSLTMPSGQSGTPPRVYSAPTGQVRPSPGPTAGSAGSQEQAWSPTSAYQFESPTFRNGAAHQLSPGPSGRTWTPAASDVTRLTVPQAEPAASQQKDSIAVLDDLLQHALEGLQVKAQLDNGSLPRKAPKQTAMKEQAGVLERKGTVSPPQVQVHSDASSSFSLNR
ncbi:MAG: hypothetical protein FRX49_06936 [Trebouxia sp. A1-2]|nr:MAG: hypothetical protein FRX49_06936 [Trebouxia sp. A1-2]